VAAAVPLALAPLGKEAKADEFPQLSEWERVYLPIDPGVVLLDISFVPDDPSHGLIFLCDVYFFFASFQSRSPMGCSGIVVCLVSCTF
jgi:hypothetical protein